MISNSLAMARGKLSSNDDYYTPPHMTESLLKREKFNGLVYEVASGDGSMSKVIEKFNDCISSDIKSECYGIPNIDFLKDDNRKQNIITNPPYRYATEFLEHSLKIVDERIAFLLPLNFLQSRRRYNLFINSPLQKVMVFCLRQTIVPVNRIVRDNGVMVYAWFIWDKSYSGKSMIEWINDDKPKRSQTLRGSSLQ